MVLIFLGSAQSDVPDVPGHFSDKQMHAVEYAGLSAVACRAAAGGALGALSAGAAVAGWGVATLYGVVDEVHQAFVPGRSPDLLDVVADATGAAIAAVGLWAWGIIARSRRERRDVLPPA
jgi:VanZ family protein